MSRDESSPRTVRRSPRGKGVTQDVEEEKDTNDFLDSTVGVLLDFKKIKRNPRKKKAITSAQSENLIDADSSPVAKRAKVNNSNLSNSPPNSSISKLNLANQSSQSVDMKGFISASQKPDCYNVSVSQDQLKHELDLFPDEHIPKVIKAKLVVHQSNSLNSHSRNRSTGVNFKKFVRKSIV